MVHMGEEVIGMGCISMAANIVRVYNGIHLFIAASVSSYLRIRGNFSIPGDRNTLYITYYISLSRMPTVHLSDAYIPGERNSQTLIRI